MAPNRFHDRPQPQSSTTTSEWVELSTINNGTRHRNATMMSSSVSWHPRFTLYRLLILVATIGLGVAKAITSYLSLNNASITLEWVLGVVFFLFFHLLGSYEEDTRRLPWLFQVDCLQYIWHALAAIFNIERPFYRSDELQHTHMQHRHPPITGYRILVTTLVFFFGMLKSAFSYGNQQSEMTTVDCVFGVGAVTCLYWLGLYETSATKVYPWLFHVDYLDKLSYALGAFPVIGKTVFYLISLGICCGFTVVIYYLTTLFFNLQWALSMFPPFPIVGYTTSALFAAMMLSIFLSGFAWCCVLVFKLLQMLLRSPLGRHLSGMAGPRHMNQFVRRTYTKYCQPDLAAGQRPSPYFYVKRVLVRQLVKLPMRLLFLYITCLLLLIIFWMLLAIATCGAMSIKPLIPVSFTFPFLSFALFSLALKFASSVFGEDIQRGFRDFLAEIRHDYRDEGIPIATSGST